MSRNVAENETAGMGMSTFQTRLSKESSKNDILVSLNEFFVSSNSVNQKFVGEMRRQRSEMLIDRTVSSSLAPKTSSTN